MKVGVPTEIKTDEYRVSLTPAGVRELVEHGHEVIVQSNAGVGSTIPDEEYTAQGARIAPDAKTVFDEAVMVIGGGVVGMNAAFIAMGMEADVFVYDRNIDCLRELDIAFGGRVSTVYSSTLAVEE